MSYGLTLYDPNRTWAQFASEVTGSGTSTASAVLRATGLGSDWREGVFKGGGNYVYELTDNAIRILKGPSGVGAVYSRTSETAQKIARELSSLGWPEMGKPRAQGPEMGKPRAQVPDPQKQEPADKTPREGTWLSQNPWVYPAGGAALLALGVAGYLVYRRR